MTLYICEKRDLAHVKAFRVSYWWIKSNRIVQMNFHENDKKAC